MKHGCPQKGRIRTVLMMYFYPNLCISVANYCFGTFDAQKYRKTRSQDLLGRASVPLGRAKTKIHHIRQ